MKKLFPQYNFIIALLLTLVISTSCSFLPTQRPTINSVSDAIAVTSADIKSVAQVVKNLCGNTVEGGDCLNEALISTSTKNSFKRSLQETLDLVSSAKNLLAAGHAVDANDKLALADSLILALQAELSRRQGGFE